MNSAMRLYINILISTLLVLTVTSCDDWMDVTEPTLGVRAENPTCRVGEQVKFTFTGSADIVSFFSDEEGHRYRYSKQGEYIPTGDVRMSFVNQLSNMAGGKTVVRRVLLSTDFNGRYKEPRELMSATWIDLTDNFTLAVNNTETPSGTLDLTPYLPDKEPFYIAFMYQHLPFYDDSAAPSWRTKYLLIEGETDDGYLTLGDISDTWYSAGFNITNFGQERGIGVLGQVQQGQINLQSEDGPILETNEIWATSRAIDPAGRYLPAEVPVPIKSQADESLTEYYYTYTEPGEYTVVFISQNATADKERHTVHTLTINVVE